MGKQKKHIEVKPPLFKNSAWIKSNTESLRNQLEKNGYERFPIFSDDDDSICTSNDGTYMTFKYEEGLNILSNEITEVEDFLKFVSEKFESYM